MAEDAESSSAMSLFGDILVIDLTSTIRGMHCTKMFDLELAQNQGTGDIARSCSLCRCAGRGLARWSFGRPGAGFCRTPRD